MNEPHNKNIEYKNTIISIRMDAELVDELTQRADSLYLSVSNYCKRVLKEWLDSDEKLNISEK